MMEQVLEDMAVATDLRAIILRYFNPIGSDPDLESGIYAKEPSHVARPAGDGRARPEGRLHDHRHRPPDPRRHRHPRLHPRLGPRPGPRARGRAVRRRASPAAGAPSVIINVGRGDGRHGARAGRRLRAGLRARRCRSARRRRGPATPSAPSPTSTGPPSSSAGGPSSRIEEAIASALAWGDEAPGDPGLRVTHRSPCRWPRRSLAASVGLAAPASATHDAGRGRPRDAAVAAAERPRRRARPGPPARQPQLPRPRSAGWCRPAASASRATRPGTATDGGYPEATFTWRVALRLQQRLEALGRHRPADPAHQPPGPLGSVRRRPRPGRQRASGADLKISVHGDGSYAAGAHGFHVIAPTDRAPWTHDIYRPSRRLALRHPGRAARRRAARSRTTSPAATASTSAPTWARSTSPTSRP